MATSPDSVTYTQTIAELVAPEVAPDWSNVARPNQPQAGMFGIARETSLMEFYDGTTWRNPIWTSGGTFTGPVNLTAGGSFAGTFSGNHTYSGALTLSAAGTALSITTGGAAIAGTLTTGPASGGSFITNQVGNTGGINIQARDAAAGVNLWSGGTSVVSATQATTQINNKLVLNPTAVVTPSGFQSYGISQSQIWTGDAGSGNGPVMNLINITDRTQTTNSGGTTAFRIQQIMDDNTSTGTKQALSVAQTISGTTGNINGKIYSPVIFSGNASANGAGTNANWGKIGSGRSSITTMNTYSLLNPGSTWWHGLAGYEMDLAVYAGSQVAVKQGLLITLISGDASQGAWVDTAILLGNQYNQSPGLGWRTGIMFGNDTATFPMDPTGTLIGAGGSLSGGYANPLAGYGIDWLMPLFSSAFLRSRLFSVDGSGTIRQGSGAISYTGTALSIDVNYVHGLAEATAISGGTIISGGTSGFSTGDILYDGFNGVYRVTANVAGVITALAVVRQSFAPVGTSATVALTYTGLSLGVGSPSITQTWTTDSTLSLQPSAGATTIGGTLAVTGATTSASYKVSSNQVVGARITGWGAGTNGAKTAFNGATATLAQTSAAVAQLIADLTTHGLIGT